MTSAFGGQRSIQLSYGCFPGKPEYEPAGEPASHGFLAEAGAGFNGQLAIGGATWLGASRLATMRIAPRPAPSQAPCPSEDSATPFPR